ncbi:GspE/PulE family protein [Proteocatella sphenisci]|uniref:GspE/PulE family protein n=1 Tax=Proteocatella sphenisci TaxID=181070 RepID=UPI0004B8EE4E|nr:GspE/PulE family protein [Proteocatella sphenisci]
MSINFEYGISKILCEKKAREYRCIPISINRGKISIAISEGVAMDIFTRINEIFNELGFVDKGYVYLSDNEIERLINTYYSIELDNPQVGAQINSFKKLRDIEGLYDYIIKKSNLLSASDIHILYENEYFIIRLRIRGKLKTLTILDKDLGESLIRIIKVSSNIEISRIRSPKDARFKYTLLNQEIDMRVSIVNTIENEKISVRILNPDNVPVNLKDLGISFEEEEIIRRTLRLNSGFVLVCGPTGSGKSTTLRCLLNEINDGLRHIISIEDPIEYTMSGITQIQIDETKEGSFKESLKSIVRQDPDVIYIGEIRDYESADIATKASLTGHLVFSTLHTRSSVSAIERIVNLGIDSASLVSSINLIINQRLAGVLCDECKQERIYEGEDIKELNLTNGQKIWEPLGCEKCNYSGYYKNVPIMDIVVFTDTTRECILRGEIPKIKNHKIKEKIALMLSKGEIELKEALKYLWY